MKKFLVICLALVFVAVAGAAALLASISASLPNLVTVKDYEPLLVSEVYDRKGKKVGEFAREKRRLLTLEKIPKVVQQAFLAAEDASFFEHSGINYFSIARAFFANLKAGKKVQGGSTITQQVARALMLSSERTYDRKIREALLSYRMEKNLSKEEILYLYLNQIYLGHGAWGVGLASEIYFQKPIESMTLPEAALIAGLTQAPSRYSPITRPKIAKDRQLYVLRRMAEVGFVSKKDSEAAAQETLQIHVRKNYMELTPHYIETVRQALVDRLGEEMVLDKGIQIYTSMDLDKQLAAQKQLEEGLRSLDKRQGFRGAKRNLTTAEAVAEFLLQTRNDLMDEAKPIRPLLPDGSLPARGPLDLDRRDAAGKILNGLPEYLQENQILDGVVVGVDDKWGFVTVRFAENKGMIDLETMKWARKPDPEIMSDSAPITKPSAALKKGDVISVRVKNKVLASPRIDALLLDMKKKQGKKFARPADLPKFDEFIALELEQDPIAQGALISLDEKTQDIVALVGGIGDFTKNQFNRAIQARRQTGSSFKAFVYAAALEKGYSPNTPITDAPIVYEEQLAEGQDTNVKSTSEEPEMKKWKPLNHSRRFAGDVLFRTALVRSLNVPTVKIIEKIGVEWSASYARRLGIFSPLNMDFTLALGSSGVTLYEMTRAFATFGTLGKKIEPILIRKVTDRSGKVLLENWTLDNRFHNEIKPIEDKFAEDRTKFFAKREEDPTQPHDSAFFFDDEKQSLRPSTAFVMTNLLQGTVDDPDGTGVAARSLGRPVAGKTGTTSGYFDAWFVGYSPDIATGVWVGFDEEDSLGRGEVGGRAALPIWLEYMKAAHKDLPVRNFPAPEGIVFANIDGENGKLASAKSKRVIRQAFVEGTEPTQVSTGSSGDEQKDFYKEDLAE